MFVEKALLFEAIHRLAMARDSTLLSRRYWEIVVGVSVSYHKNRLPARQVHTSVESMYQLAPLYFVGFVSLHSLCICHLDQRRGEVPSASRKVLTVEVRYEELGAKTVLCLLR